MGVVVHNGGFDTGNGVHVTTDVGCGPGSDTIGRYKREEKKMGVRG